MKLYEVHPYIEKPLCDLEKDLRREVLIVEAKNVFEARKKYKEFIECSKHTFLFVCEVRRRKHEIAQERVAMKRELRKNNLHFDNDLDDDLLFSLIEAVNSPFFKTVQRDFNQAGYDIGKFKGHTGLGWYALKRGDYNTALNWKFVGGSLDSAYNSIILQQAREMMK